MYRIVTGVQHDCTIFANSCHYLNDLISYHLCQSYKVLEFVTLYDVFVLMAYGYLETFIFMISEPLFLILLALLYQIEASASFFHMSRFVFIH